MLKKVNSYSLAIALSLLILVLHYYIRTYNYENWKNVLGWDVLSYYLCLPFTFIYNDPGMVNQDIIKYIFDNYQPSGTFYQAYKLENGNWISMYTIGLAVLYAPFFFIAHLWASLSGTYPADGFSFPYQYTIGNGVMLYIMYGIFVIRKVLLHFFSDRMTMAVMVLLLLGTNYFHEATSDDCMPHAILFTAYALILLLTIQWHKKQSYKTIALLGLILGFTILARGTAIVCLFIPFLWNIYDKASLQAKIELLKIHWRHLLVGTLCFFIVPSLQMVFWKVVTGNFIFHSYQNTEGFDWDGQHLMKVLFSYKKSWFLYTPMIVLPIIGVFLMRKLCKPVFLAQAAFFLVNFYIIASWAAWWQGGSFGMRYFVESYAMMAIPMGYFIQYIRTTPLVIKSIVTLLTSFFLFLNLFQTWQFNNWMIDGYAMTKEYYWKIFLKTKVSEEDRKLKEVDRGNFSKDVFKNPEDYNKRTIGFYNYETFNSTYVDPVFLDSLHSVSKPYSCRLTKDRIYLPTLRMPFHKITDKEHAWINVSLNYLAKEDLKEVPASLVICFEHEGRHTYKYIGWDLDKLGGEADKWHYLSVDYLTPYPYSVDDILMVYVYLREDKDIYIDNLHIKAFERKW